MNDAIKTATETVNATRAAVLATACTYSNVCQGKTEAEDANEGHAQREAWHVVDQSHELGIVDAHGMVDVSGEIARRFRVSYVRAYRAECAKLPAGHW